MAQQTRVVAVKAESPARPSHPRSMAALLMKREMPVLGLSDFLKDKVRCAAQQYKTSISCVPPFYPFQSHTCSLHLL